MASVAGVDSDSLPMTRIEDIENNCLLDLQLHDVAVEAIGEFSGNLHAHVDSNKLPKILEKTSRAIGMDGVADVPIVDDVANFDNDVSFVGFVDGISHGMKSGPTLESTHHTTTLISHTGVMTDKLIKSNTDIGTTSTL